MLKLDQNSASLIVQARQRISAIQIWLTFIPRLSTFRLVLIFSFSYLTFHSCGLDIEDPTPPAPPVWVEKSLPEEWPERGIDAHESGGIYLEWEQNSEQDIVAYNIYRAVWHENYDSLGDYYQLSRLENESILEMKYIDNQIGTGNTYYYKLISEDGAGNLSNYSDSVKYTILPQIALSGMIPNGIDDTLSQERTFSWRYDFSIEMEYYCLTIVTNTGEYVRRYIFLPQTYVDIREYFELPNDTNMVSGHLYKWRIDFGANYIQENETSGSESPWATFVMME